MARDKLITIRIEGEKREAFNNLAKSQNTDTASLLYDFISGCLDGRIDISLVTGKKQWIDKIDNQLDTNRLDKLETDTQRIDHWIGALSERVNDWILRSDRRVNDCEKGLSEKMINLEHRLNALSMQLDSQKDSHPDSQLDSHKDSHQIDTDRQQETPDMEPLLKREREASIATSPIVEPTGETSPLPPDEPGEGGNANTPEVSPSPPSPALEAIEGSGKKITLPDTLIGSPIGTVESGSEPGTDAIETVGMTAMAAVDYLKAKRVTVSYASLHRWIGREKIPNTSPQGRDALKHLILRAGLYYPNPDQP